MDSHRRYYRKVIKITAWDSPNVILALRQRELGLEPTNEIVLDGVVTWDDLNKRLATWDEVKKCIGLYANFYVGALTLMFPPTWLDGAQERARQLVGIPRRAKAIGIDPGEGVAETTMAAGDERGLIEMVAQKTPDTSDVTTHALAFMRQHNVPPNKVFFDSGGGGRQHADRLRKLGFPVETVSFGESVTPQLKRRGVVTPLKERKYEKEERYVYLNRRAQMYHGIRLRIDPSLNEYPFAIPAQYTELRRQLAPIPLDYDEEGRIWLLPKNKKDKDSKKKTLIELLGCSPDQADALALLVYGLDYKPMVTRAGVPA